MSIAYKEYNELWGKFSVMFLSPLLSLSLTALANQHNHLLAIVYRSSISGKTLRIDWQKEMRTIIYSKLKIRLRFRCEFVVARVLCN